MKKNIQYIRPINKSRLQPKIISTNKKYYSAIALIIKDEFDLLQEWLIHVRRIGFDHVYIMDNGTNPPHREYLEEYISAGYITYLYDRGFPIQTKFYNDCLSRFRRETHWLACIDSDEFIVLKQHSKINEFLREYENFGAIAMAWYIYGTSGHREHQQSTILAYSRRMSDELHKQNPQSHYYHYKMIYQTDYTMSAGIHSGRYFPGYFAVDESRERVSGDTPNKIKTDIIQLNHYAVRSREDFEKKMRRAAADGSWRRQDFIDTVEQFATVEDWSIIERHYPQLIKYRIFS